jgi:hypothetical protein
LRWTTSSYYNISAYYDNYNYYHYHYYYCSAYYNYHHYYCSTYYNYYSWAPRCLL